MKTLTLTQPWAILIAIGAKKIETRSWNTNYRGPLAIHAAKGFPQEAQHVCFNVPFRDYLGDYVALNETYFGQHKFPLGAIVAMCELVRVDRIKEGYEKYITYNERSFGDYTPGRFAWILENITALEKPVFAKGALSLWEWDDSCVSSI